MTLTIRTDGPAALPEPAAVLEHQGLPAGVEIPERIAALQDEATSLFVELARPAAMFGELEPVEFERVFEGEGKNAPDAIVGHIYPRASALALFAGTVGGEVSTRISELFNDRDYALAAMLDSVASTAADRMGELVAGHYHDALVQRRQLPEGDIVLGYSPGYCGWHLTGQKELFARLRPERIGMTLNESCLMTPLKSVSGVLIAGPADIHVFRPGFSYCPDCHDRSCLARMEALTG